MGFFAEHGSYGDSGEHRTDRYAGYLASPAWRKKREAALKRAGFQCERCKTSKGLQVHHLTYARLGHELPRDLMVLCPACHRRADAQRKMETGYRRKAAKRKKPLEDWF